MEANHQPTSQQRISRTRYFLRQRLQQCSRTFQDDGVVYPFAGVNRSTTVTVAHTSPGNQFPTRKAAIKFNECAGSFQFP